MSENSYPVFVAVDSQNLYHACKEEFGEDSKVDFRKLKEVIAENLLRFSQRLSVDAIVYTVASSRYGNSAFVNMLQAMGFATKTQYVTYEPHRDRVSGRKEWSVGITIDVLKKLQGSDLRRFVLVSGSGSFEALVNELKQNGVPTDVYGFRLSASQDLMDSAERGFLLDDSVVWRGKKRD